MTVQDIAAAIEDFAPLPLQEDYDNAGLQVGFRDRPVNAVMLCLDVTEEVLEEAIRRKCDMIVSHHPLIFRGLKNLTGADETQRIAIRALEAGVAIYSAHTNLDSAWNGVSHEMAHTLGLTDKGDGHISLDITTDGQHEVLPTLRGVNEHGKIVVVRIHLQIQFAVKALRYSSQSPTLVIKRVALCGGSGASLIREAMRAGADLYVTGDIKYHDFAGYGQQMVIADIGHYESELCSMKIFSRIIRQQYPELVVYFSDDQRNPVGIM